MELSQEQIETMERHRLGKLAEPDLRNFEKLLADNPEFAQEYRLFLASVEATQLAAREEERDKLRTIEDRLKKEDETTKSERRGKARRGGRGKRPSRWAVAAAVLLLVSFAGYRLGMPGKPEMADLFEQYYQPYQNLVTKQSAEGDAELLQGMDRYDAGDFPAALAKFEALPDSLRDSDLLRIYRGICLLETNEPALAKDVLQPVLDRGDSMFPAGGGSNQRLKGTAAWYMGMASLQSEDLEGAKAFFGQASVYDAFYRAKSEQIMAKLAEIKH